MVAGLDEQGASSALLEKLRRAASPSASANANASSTGGGGARVGPSKATMVTVEGGGYGGGLLEAKPRESLSAIKLFLHKCLYA